MKHKETWTYLDGFGSAKRVLELDALAVQEIMEALDPQRADPLLNPWKRGYNAAIRSALGH